jgi:hypothetical protein
MDAHLSSHLLRHLEMAGWRADRNVPVSGSVPTTHPAWQALSNLGGLHVVPELDTGIECGACDIEFNAPAAPSEVVRWARLLGSTLVPVAEVGGGHGLLCIASDGTCYGSSYIHDAFYFEGERLEVALDRILLGKKARPMLRPDQSQVMLYGQTFVRGNPEVFPWQSQT